MNLEELDKHRREYNEKMTTIHTSFSQWLEKMREIQTRVNALFSLYAEYIERVGQ